MKLSWHMVKAGLSAIGGWAGWFLGGMDGFLYALVAFVVIDYIGTIMVAIVNRELLSKINFQSILKKIFIFTMVGIGHTLDAHIVSCGHAFRTAIIFFYLSNEGISLIQNASRLGLSVPGKLREILSQLKDKSGDDGEE